MYRSFASVEGLYTPAAAAYSLAHKARERHRKGILPKLLSSDIVRHCAPGAQGEVRAFYNGYDLMLHLQV